MFEPRQRTPPCVVNTKFKDDYPPLSSNIAIENPWKSQIFIEVLMETSAILDFHGF